MDDRTLLKIALIGAVFGVVGLFVMSMYTTDVNMTFIMVSAVVFGIGSGFSFVPLNVTTFWTLDPRHRGMATGLFALVSILGGSVGISVMVNYLVRSAQINRSILMEEVSPFSDVLRYVPLPPDWSLSDPVGLAAVAEEVQRQAMMIAYVNNFHVLAVLTLLCVPFIYFMRKPRAKMSAGAQPVPLPNIKAPF